MTERRRRTPPRSAPTRCLALLILLLCALLLGGASAFSPSSISTTRVRAFPPSANGALFSSNDDTDSLLEKARRLRQDVAAIESDKAEIQREKDVEEQARFEAEEELKKEKDATRLRYSAVVPILKDMGDEVMERIDFPPRLKGGKSRILAVTAPLPLGLVLGQDESTPGLTCVDEVAPEGNGDAAGIREGDIVRAVTACQTTMETPTWQLLAGGIGQPKTKRFIYSADGRPLEEVLDAVGSNRMDANGRDAWLVLERVD